VITGRDVTVWIASALLAAGVGWSRYAKWKTRERLVREFAAMDPAKREKVLSRMDPKLALEIREQLLERFQILS
jgi:flagellar motility protein MotE (MotC chaperone)